MTMKIKKDQEGPVVESIDINEENITDFHSKSCFLSISKLFIDSESLQLLIIINSLFL